MKCQTNRMAIVRLREVMQTADFVNHKSKLAIALGRDVAGHPMVVDLAKMPYMLIAGATGTGKSVSINSLFISLLYRNTPQDVKFIVIDPKRVELNLYNGIPHLLTPVVIETEKRLTRLSGPWRKWTGATNCFPAGQEKYNRIQRKRALKNAVHCNFGR